MDEPTSALTGTEVQRLLSIMDTAAQGRRRDHVRDAPAGGGLGHLRPHDGAARRQARRASRPRPARRSSIPQIIEKMVGPRRLRELRAPAANAGPPATCGSACAACARCATRKRRMPSCSKASISTSRPARSSGVAGLVGSGRTELARAIFGADRIAAGTITLEGKPIAPAHRRPMPSRSASAWCRRIASSQAIFAALGILTNFSVAALGPLQQRLRLHGRAARDARRWPSTRRCCRSAWLRPSRRSKGCRAATSRRSILARWLARDPKVLIVDEPTRGVDVGAKAEVHQILVQLAARGIAVMMISSELPEVLAVTDRIVTMRRGRITGEMPAVEGGRKRN